MRGHIRKRGRSWNSVVYVGRDGNGRRRYKWYTHRSRREAEHHLAQVLAAGGIAPSVKTRLSDYLEQWLKDYAEGVVAPTTLDRYRGIIRGSPVRIVGDIPLSRLTPQMIQGYLSTQLARGLSSTTVLHHYRVLRKALKHAVRWGLLTRNPADMVDPPRRRRHGIKVWDEEQIRLFLAEARRSSKHYLLYLTALMTGMRQGELLGLRWRDVDLVEGRASIQQTFYRLGRQELFKEPKTPGARRTIPLPTVVVDELASLKVGQDYARLQLGNGYTDLGLVFCQPNGKPLRANNIVRRDFRKVIERVGLPVMRFHDLRHSHASHLLKQGTNAKVVQERLGHSSTAFTLSVYGHVLPGMQEDATRQLAERLLGRKETAKTEDVL